MSAVAKATAGGGQPFGPHAPSILLPLRFMVGGLLALLTGVGLLVVRPDLLATYHYNQFVIATTHLLVLGWITTIVMGAMYQLVPVALETKLFSERLARWQFVLHAAGVVGMVWMFWRWNMAQVGHFGAVLAFGVGLFVYNIARTLWRVPRWNVVATAVTSALVWLVFAVLAGLTLAAAKASYESGASEGAGTFGPLVHSLKLLAAFMARFDQMGAMHAHAHLGALGLFTMLIVGISYKLLPMFTLSELQSPARARASLLLLNLGLAGLFFGILFRSKLKFVFALSVAAALVVYGLEVLAILRARKRRTLDWGVKYFLTALGMLVPACVLALVLSWPTLPLTGLTGQLENLYGFLGFMGVISFAIIGMLYKIIPFLVWYRSYSPRIGLARVPSLADLYSSRLQAAGYWSYLLGLIVTGAGIVLGHAPCVRCGCALLLASLLVLAANIIKMLGHLFWPVTVPAEAKTPAKLLRLPSRRAGELKQANA